MHTLPRHESKFAHIADPLRRTYAGMLSALDDGVGAILKTLEKNRLTRDTVVIFASDNGGPTPVNTSRNAPLRGLKAQIYEGGIRVPFLMQWPSRLPKNKVYSQPVIALDLLPTMIAAAGGKTDASWKLDGVNLLPHVEGKDKKAPHERLLWRFGQQWAIREGDWKLMSMGGPPELYNLRADIGESQDLSAKEKDRMARMAATWEEWNKKNMAPLWHAPGAQGQKGKKKKKKKKGD
jgi:arylsulfatase A-like enzyme